MRRITFRYKKKQLISKTLRDIIKESLKLTLVT